MNERKALKELQTDTSIVILPANEGRSIVILNRKCYLEKFMDHINSGPYQLLKKDPTTKIKANTKSLTPSSFSHSLHQLIVESTRTTERTKTLIDHILTNSSEKVIQSGVIEVGLSDHMEI